MTEQEKKTVTCLAHVYDKDQKGPFILLYYEDPNAPQHNRTSLGLHQSDDIWHRVRFDLFLTKPEIEFVHEESAWKMQQILLPYDAINHFDKPIFPNGHPLGGTRC